MLGELLAPTLTEFGLIPRHLFHTGYVDCLMEEGCNCRICEPPEPDYSTWMIRVSPNSGTVGVYVDFDKVVIIDYVSTKTIKVSIFDLEIYNKMCSIIPASMEAAKKGQHKWGD